MCKKSRFLSIAASASFFICIFIIGSLLLPSFTAAQYWALMPPYNVLWPLYSPALSPLDPVTGLPTPLISELTASTILPVQPCMVWDPSQPAPWPLYNTPQTFGSGLLFFDWQYGLNAWPPPYLVDPITSAPTPITWLTTWSLIAPFDFHHLEFLIPLANATYALNFGITGQPFLNLLTTAQILGLPPL